MKKTVYINSANAEKLKEVKNKTTSSIINEALEMYFNGYSFDTSTLRCKNSYGLAVFRIHKEVIRFLKGLAENFDNKAANEFLMYLIVKELENQTNRKHFPDRVYVGLDWINKEIEKLSRCADLQKLKRLK